MLHEESFKFLRDFKYLLNGLANHVNRIMIDNDYETYLAKRERIFIHKLLYLDVSIVCFFVTEHAITFN